MLLTIRINEDIVPSRKFPASADANQYLNCHVFFPLHDRHQAELERRFENLSEICVLFSGLLQGWERGTVEESV